MRITRHDSRLALIERLRSERQFQPDSSHSSFPPLTPAKEAQRCPNSANFVKPRREEQMLRRLCSMSAHLALLICISIGSLAECANALTVAPGYTSTEISYIAHQMTWMDDETVLFAGTRQANSATSSQRATWGPQAIYQWNVRNGEVKQIMEAGEGATILCYDRGYMYVTFHRGDDRVVRQGPIGHEKETIYKKRDQPPFKGVFNRYSCRWQEKPKPTNIDSSIFAVLRDDHGHIETDQPANPTPGFHRYSYFLVRPSGERILLDFHGGMGGPRFSEFLGAYVFQDPSGDLSGNREKQIWAVQPNGKVTGYKLPTGAWMSGSISAMPIRDGVVIISRALFAKAEGVYVLRTKEVERLIPGYVNAFAVSPNGCKLVANIRPGSYDNDVVVRNMVVSVC